MLCYAMLCYVWFARTDSSLRSATAASVTSAAAAFWRLVGDDDLGDGGLADDDLGDGGLPLPLSAPAIASSRACQAPGVHRRQA